MTQMTFPNFLVLLTFASSKSKMKKIEKFNNVPVNNHFKVSILHIENYRSNSDYHTLFSVIDMPYRIPG